MIDSIFNIRNFICNWNTFTARYNNEVVNVQSLTYIGEMILQQKKKVYFFLLCIGLYGCSSIMDFTHGEKLEPRVRAFSNAIRWSNFEEAQKFVSMRDNQIQNQNMDFLKHIKVTKYSFIKNTTRHNADDETSDIISIYNIDYYHDGNYQIQHLRYEQLWWYDDTMETWFINSGLPPFKY